MNWFTLLLVLIVGSFAASVDLVVRYTPEEPVILVQSWIPGVQVFLPVAPLHFAAFVSPRIFSMRTEGLDDDQVAEAEWTLTIAADKITAIRDNLWDVLFRSPQIPQGVVKAKVLWDIKLILVSISDDLCESLIRAYLWPSCNVWHLFKDPSMTGSASAVERCPPFMIITRNALFTSRFPNIDCQVDLLLQLGLSIRMLSRKDRVRVINPFGFSRLCWLDFGKLGRQHESDHRTRVRISDNDLTRIFQCPDIVKLVATERTLSSSALCSYSSTNLFRFIGLFHKSEDGQWRGSTRLSYSTRRYGDKKYLSVLKIRATVEQKLMDLAILPTKRFYPSLSICQISKDNMHNSPLLSLPSDILAMIWGNVLPENIQSRYVCKGIYTFLPFALSTPSKFAEFLVTTSSVTMDRLIEWLISMIVSIEDRIGPTFPECIDNLKSALTTFVSWSFPTWTEIQLLQDLKEEQCPSHLQKYGHIMPVIYEILGSPILLRITTASCESYELSDDDEPKVVG